MQLVYTNADQYLFRFDKGEDVIAELQSFCSSHHICVGTFTGIGSAEKVVLAYYDLDEKQYEDHTIDERVEVTSMMGHVSIVDDTAHIHAHGVIGNKNLGAQTGHIQSLVVSATCEVMLTALEGSVTRTEDPETGLSLLAPHAN